MRELLVQRGDEFLNLIRFPLYPLRLFEQSDAGLYGRFPQVFI